MRGAIVDFDPATLGRIYMDGHTAVLEFPLQTQYDDNVEPVDCSCELRIADAEIRKSPATAETEIDDFTVESELEIRSCLLPLGYEVHGKVSYTAMYEGQVVIAVVGNGIALQITGKH